MSHCNIFIAFHFTEDLCMCYVHRCMHIMHRGTAAKDSVTACKNRSGLNTSRTVGENLHHRTEHMVFMNTQMPEVNSYSAELTQKYVHKHCVFMIST